MDSIHVPVSTSAQRVPQVFSVIERLDMRISAQEELIKKLLARLTPVVSGSDRALPNSEPPKELCPAASRLAQLSDKLDLHNTILGDLLDRLEV